MKSKNVSIKKKLNPPARSKKNSEKVRLTGEKVKKEKMKREKKQRALKNRILINAFGTFEPRQRKIRNLTELCSLKAGKLFSHIYQLSTKAKFAYDDGTFDVYETARNWFERTSATTQCENTSAGKKANLKDTDACYICGLSLKNGDNLECEHILPVAQACLFLDLYRDEYKQIMKSGEKLSSLHSQIKENLGVEYKWAHECCNQIKSHISFIKFDEKKNEFILDEDSSTTILKGIFYGKMKNEKGSEEDRKYCNNTKTQLLKKHGRFDAFLKERLEIKQKTDVESLNTTIKPILTILNRNYNKGSNLGFYYMGILSNIILAADANLINAATQSSIGNGIIIPPPNESDNKTKVYTQLSFLFADFFEKNSLDVGRDRDKRNNLDNDVRNLFVFRADLLQNFRPILKNNAFDLDSFNKFIMDVFIRNQFSREETLILNYNTIYRNLFAVLLFNTVPSDQIIASTDAGLFLKTIILCFILENVKNANENAIAFRVNLDGSETPARKTLIKFEQLLASEIKLQIKKIKENHEEDSTDVFSILLSIYGYLNENNTGHLEYFLHNLSNKSPNKGSEMLLDEEYKKITIRKMEKYGDLENILLTSSLEYYNKFTDEFKIKEADEDEITKLEVGAANAFASIQFDKTIQYDDVSTLLEKISLIKKKEGNSNTKKRERERSPELSETSTSKSPSQSKTRKRLKLLLTQYKSNPISGQLTESEARIRPSIVSNRGYSVKKRSRSPTDNTPSL